VLLAKDILPVRRFFSALLMVAGVFLCVQNVWSQTNPEALAQAQAAIAKRDWATAEALLTPLMQVQAKDPFVYYEMALVYENTNRIEAAKQIYQGLITIPDAQQKQYAVLIRTPTTSYLTSLVSLSQAKLNVINANLAAANIGKPTAIAPVPTPAQAAVTPRAVPVDVANAPAQRPAVIAANLPNNALNPEVGIRTVLFDWAKAWANKDMPNYFSHYVSDYKGGLRLPSDWKQQRTALITTKKTIALELEEIKISLINPNRATVVFKQNYKSDNYSNVAKKTLILTKRNDRWLIERESS
jgi:hypothetical protein